ncbi:acyltransferase [Streptomyces sp. NPDC089919]|uniref:acyltransferase family protein n=1 Tax=Streptomyces sp. NPDC089919 TaxID=3155188 RepID=UPI0034162318
MTTGLIEAKHSAPVRGTIAAPGALPRRLDCLTSLRFFAALGVFLHHFTGIGDKTGYGTAPLVFPYSQMAAQGVTFFFVLSGFVLTWTHKPEQSAGAFYWRRIARIWPATLVTAVPAYLVFYVMAHQRTHWGSLVSSLFLVQNWFPNSRPSLPGNPVTWTLSVELLFYALFPFAARFLVRLRTRSLVVLTAAGLASMVLVSNLAGAHHPAAFAAWIARTPPYHLPEFLVGITLAVAVRRGWRPRLHPAVPLLALAAYTYAYYRWIPRLSDTWSQQAGYSLRPVIAVLAALVMLAFVQREIAGRRGLLNRPALVNLGVWSYCFYLIHHTVSRWATYEFGRTADNDGALFAFLGMGLVITVLAWATHRYVEEPANRWLVAHLPARLERGGRRGRALHRATG